jgi:O-antigen/teichoic acid export membrane protein
MAVSLAEAGSKLIGLLLIPIFTHYLSPEDFGIISMITITMTVLALIYNPGMQSATIRLYHSCDLISEKQELIGSTYRFYIIIPLFFLILSIFFGPGLFKLVFNDFDFYPYGFIAFCLAFFAQPKKIWIALNTLQYKIHVTAIYSLIAIVLGLIVSVVLVVVLKLGVLGRILGMFPPVLLFFYMSFSSIRKYSNGIWSVKSIKKQLVFGFPLIFAIISYEILMISGQYFLERMGNLSMAGMYSLAYTLASLPMFLVLGIRQLWGPIFFENMNKKEYNLLSKLAKAYLLIITIISLLLILFSKEIIVIFINHRFYKTISIIVIMIVGVYFNGLLTITNSFLGYANKFGKISQIAMIAAIVNVGLNVLLIPIIEIKGAAIAAMVSYIVYFGISIYVSRKQILLIVAKKTFLINIFSLIVVSLTTYLMNVYFEYQTSLLELSIKLFILILVAGIFIKSRLIDKNEVLFLKHIIIDLLRKKKSDKQIKK